MKRCFTFILSLFFALSLTACGDRTAPSSGFPSDGAGLVAPQPEDVPDAPDIPDENPDTSSEDFTTATEDESTPVTENIPVQNTEDEATDPKENIDYSKMKQFITPLIDVAGGEIGVLSFAIQFPEDWTVSDNFIYDAEERQIAEILPSILFEDESVFDKMAEQYPDSEPISVTVAGFSGICFIHQTPSDDPAFVGSFNNEVFYYLEVEDWLICIRFIPAPGVGIGTQRETFQTDIKAII